MTMGKPDIKKSEETNRQIDSDTKGNSKQQIVEKANERPEWLPDGWNVEVRTRKSGPNMGSGYKCYTDPLNGHKFYSKPEVLRYLETIKDNSCTPKKEKKTKDNSCTPKKEKKKNTKDNSCTPMKEKKCTNMHSPSKEEDKCTDTHSPSKKNDKGINRHSSSKKGDKCADMHSPSKEEDKCAGMHSPSKEEDKGTDMHSPSKKEDICTDMHSPSKKEDKCTDMNSPSNVVVEKSTAEDLPPGWIKEIKIRKNRNGIRKDPFYTDPVSGYVFRSKKDVLRYLESGDIGKCAFKPSRRQIQDEDHLTPSPAAKRQKLKQSASEQPIFVAKEPVDKSNLELPGINNSRKGHSLEDGAANPPEMNKTSNPGSSALLKHESLKESEKMLCADGVQEKEHVANMMENAYENNHGNHSISKKEFKVGHRFSRRLARIEPVQLADNVINEQTLEVPKRNLRKNRPTLDADMENKSSQHFNGVPGYKSKKSKEVEAELRQSEGGPVAKLLDHAPINGKSGNKRRKSPKIPPIADNQLEKFEDEVHGEKLEPQLSFAFHYSWSDPCVEFAINTLTGVLSPVENSVDNGPSTVSETNIQKTVLDNVNGRSRDSQSNSVNEPTIVPETDIQKSLFNNVTGKSRDSLNNSPDNVTGSRDRNKPVQSNKSKRKKEVKAPMRLSKRLAGLEPEVRPSERPLEYSTKKSCKEEPTATAILTNGASDRLNAGEETKLSLHAPDSLKTEVLGESSNKSEKSYDAQTVRKEQQLEKVEAKNIGDDRSEPQLSLPFGESWSDPCLEFAFKTLTGALPVDSAAEIFPVMTPDVDGLPNSELHGRVTTSINVEAHDNSNQCQNKKVLNMDGQPSKLFLGQLELRTSSTSDKNAAKFITGESQSDEGNILRNLDGVPLYVEAGNATQHLHHPITNINSRIHEEPLKKNGQVAAGEFGTSTTEQPPLRTETLNHDNTELQFCESFMNSWSDPCLEFAFKTLTGEIPVEESLASQGRIQEPANCHEGGDGGSKLPDFGSSSFTQSDLLFHYDTGVKSMPGQQSSMSSSFPSLSLQGCPGVDPQNHYAQLNKNFQRR